MLSKTTVFVVNKYLSSKSIDKDENTKQLRSNTDDVNIDKLPLKTVKTMNLSTHISNPYILSRVERLTEIQSLIRKYCSDKYFEKHGSLAVSASCGSGKTYCGCYLIYKFQCKTLIISTRNAVKDQWKIIINKLYPELKVYTNDMKMEMKLCDYDVWILTPQYLNVKDRIIDSEFNIQPSLIIYDEIHTMLSSGSKTHEHEFANILKYPFIRCINKEWSELPYLVALSATYPKENRAIQKIFGPIVELEHNKISEIPINVWDYRNYYKNRGKFDTKYIVPNQIDFIKYLISNIPFIYNDKLIEIEKQKLNVEYKFEPITLSKSLKGVIMMYNIDTSVWCALYIQKTLNCNVLLIRTTNQNSYYLPKDSTKDFDFDESISFSEFEISKRFEIIDDYHKYIDKCEIVVSTLQRMKEGFSVENLVWGICPVFPYSELSRVQICGRIRRTSEKEEINKAKRILYVCSGKVPSSLYKTGKFSLKNAEETYDWEFEKTLFKRENINYI